MTKKTTTTFALAACAAVIVLLGAGCSQKHLAERDAKKAGEAVCDIGSADNLDDAQAAADEAREQLDDLASKYALYTAEDREDIQDNLADLAEHAIQGNELLVHQDLAVLQRSADNIRNDTSEVSQAAWDGFLEGLSDCTD